MIKLESLHLSSQSKDIDEIFSKKTKIDTNQNIDKILDSKYKECKQILNDNLDDYLSLYDDGLKLIIRIHELTKKNHLDNKMGLTFVVLSSKIVTLMIGIRKMIYSGLSDSLKNLNRPLIETIDIFYASIINKDLSDSFSKVDELYDNNKFYWENFSKDKLSKQCNKLFCEISMTDEYIEFLNERRKKLKSFFSESIHSSFNSAFSNYTMFTLDFDFSDNYYGKVTTAYPSILMTLIEEIYIFSNVFYISLDKKISEDFVNIEMHNVDPLYFHFHTKFDYLYTKNHKILTVQSELHSNFISEIMEEVKKINNL